MVATGEGHTVIIERDGTVWVWGYGAYDQLGLGDDVSSQLVPTHLDAAGGGAFGGVGVCTTVCVDAHSVYVTKNGDLWLWGAGNASALGHTDTRISLVPTFVDARFGRASIVWVSAGGSQSVTMTEHGDLYTCGKAEQVCHTHRCPARTTRQHGGAHARCPALDAACARWVLPQPAAPPRPRLRYGQLRVPESHCAHSLSILIV